MPVGLSEPENLQPIAGIKLASCASGIKTNGAVDTVLIQIAPGSTTAATFTQNAFCAAPVTVSRQHLDQSSPRALIINSGNANAGTGAAGMEAAISSCESIAAALQCDTTQVLPFSTGVIGELLPVEKIHQSATALVDSLAADNWLAAAQGIMTTDTIAKAVSRQVEIDGTSVTITGMAKGSGMICPNMATMLAYVATDAEITSPVLDQMIKRLVDVSFNSITVDSDTSTNDSCVLIATGQSGLAVDEHNPTFMSAIGEVFTHLAQAIIRDGEGATKFVTVQVEQSRSYQEAKQVAYTIAHSPLVKTALFASDPNWGRILAAVGRADIENLDVEQVNIFLGDVCIVADGERAKSYTEELGQQEMDREAITIRVELGRGEHEATVWTSDLSHEYVRINAEYRT